MRHLVSFVFFLSLHAYSQVFTGTGGSITDNGQPTFFTIPVSGLTHPGLDSSYGLVKVCLSITHTWDSDLDVQLVAPDGTSLTLFSGIGGDGDHFTQTCFQDNALANIVQGNPPFSGIFSSMDLLGDANNGQNGNGDWKLRITDQYAPDAGTLDAWSIEFGPHAGLPIGVDSSHLPLIQINTLGQTISDEPKITAQMGIIDKGPGYFNHPTDPPNAYNGSIGIEIRGSYSASLPQKPYGFETRDGNGDNLDVPLLSMPAENDWILLSTYNDKTFMRNSLALELFRKMGRYAPRSRFCELLINQRYKGVYLLMEKIKRDSKRVNIAKLDTNENTGDDVTGGYIIKVDYHDASNSWQSSFSPINHPSFPVFYVYEYPDAQVISEPQKTYIQGFMYALEDALYGPDFKDPTLGYRAYLHTSSLIDYLIVNELARNNDGFKKSYYFHKDKESNGGLLHSGPVWDFDWAWKNIDECSIFAATNGSGWAYNVNDCNPDNNSPAWAKRLLQDPAFTNELKCRYKELRSTLLDTNTLFHYVDSIHTLMQVPQARHFKKWPILGINVGTPEVDPQPTTYDGEIAKFKRWIKVRLAWLDTHMPGQCTFSGNHKTESPVFRMFPNPAGNKLYLESSDAIESLSVFNSEGKTVLQIEQPGFSVSLSLAALPSGMYWLTCRLQDGGLLVRRTFSKE